jgi:hypothetical protein
MARTPPRFVVSRLGFAFAVHDTQTPQEYAFEAFKPHKSSNPLNGERVGLFPTREEAERFAWELNQKHAQRHAEGGGGPISPPAARAS